MKVIKYECNHVSCKLDCHKGTVNMSEEKFKVLCDAERDPDKFRVTALFCKIQSDCSATIKSVDGVELFSTADCELQDKINKKTHQIEVLKRQFKTQEKILKDQIRSLKGELKARKPKTKKKKATKTEPKPENNMTEGFSFLVKDVEGEE